MSWGYGTQKRGHAQKWAPIRALFIFYFFKALLFVPFTSCTPNGLPPPFNIPAGTLRLCDSACALQPLFNSPSCGRYRCHCCCHYRCRLPDIESTSSTLTLALILNPPPHLNLASSHPRILAPLRIVGLHRRQIAQSHSHPSRDAIE